MNTEKWCRVWRFYAPLICFLATVLFLFALKLNSWLQVPLALVILACFVDAVIALALSVAQLWHTVRRLSGDGA